jgi:hypothetical protein
MGNQAKFELLRNYFDQYLIVVKRGKNKPKFPKKDFFSKISKLYPICMKIISNVKNNVSNVF